MLSVGAKVVFLDWKKKGFWSKTVIRARSHFLLLEIRNLQDGIANFFTNREKMRLLAQIITSTKRL